jgi:hypothetical protein
MRQVVRCRTRVVVGMAARLHTDGLGRKRGEEGFHVFRTQKRTEVDSCRVGRNQTVSSREHFPELQQECAVYNALTCLSRRLQRRKEEEDELGLAAKDGPDQLNGSG